VSRAPRVELVLEAIIPKVVWMPTPPPRTHIRVCTTLQTAHTVYTDKQPSDKKPNEKVEDEMGGGSSGSEQVVAFASDVTREGKGSGTGGAIGAAGSTNGQAALRESNMKKRAIALSSKKINGAEADAGTGGAPKETAVPGGAGKETSAVRVDPRKGKPAILEAQGRIR
jgi:hypothetical protein